MDETGRERARTKNYYRGRRRRRMRYCGCLSAILLFFGIAVVGSLALHGVMENKRQEAERARGQEIGQIGNEEKRGAEDEAAVFGMSDKAAGLSETIAGLADMAARQWGIEKPVRREWDDVLDRLEELSAESTDIAQICKDSSQYPEKLLEALANNPEMEYFVKYYPSFAGSTSGGLTEEEKGEAVPLFLQWDLRWGYQRYGTDGVIGLAGCGPTCLSMVLYALTRDESLTPGRIAEYAEKNGYYIDGIGTSWSLLWDVPGEFGVKVRQPRFTEQSMKRELNAGRLIILSMGPGDFTTAGHFIVVYGYEEDGFLIHDPNCIARSGKHWDFAQIEAQIKNLWSFWKE